FLIDELGERLARGPAQFRIVVQLAGAGDRTDDATEVWPDDRPTVELGVLSVTGKVADSDATQRALAFDPLHLVDGIEASDDPLLEVRSAVYAVSRRRRKSGGSRAMGAYGASGPTMGADAGGSPTRLLPALP